MDFDVIIIGAGPVGSTVAETIGKENHRVLILEEHAEVGSPTHCTGKISVNAFKELNLESESVINEVIGANFYSPNGQSLHLERPVPQAYILDRKIFDQRCAKKAMKEGAELLTEARVTDVRITKEGAFVFFLHKGETKKYKTRMVVGADGAKSLVARRVGLYSQKTSKLRIAIQKEIFGITNLQQGIVEVFLGNNYAPGFFAWIVPTGNDSARVGLGLRLGLKENPKKYLDKLITTHPIIKEKLQGCSANTTQVHILPTGGALNQTVSEGILLVGDAAGQIKSTTGGGLYYGMLSAKIAGRTISKSLERSSSSVLSTKSLLDYQRLWKAKLNREIQISVRLRAFLTSLTDGEIDYLFRLIISNPRLFKEIVTKGDIDWQSQIATKVVNSLLKTLIKRPRILYKMIKILLS
jgi:digeranylgeranylglycerophospholipid reductase